MKSNVDIKYSEFGIEIPREHSFVNHESKILKLLITKYEISVIYEDSEWWLNEEDKERFENAVRNYRGYKFWIIKILNSLIKRLEK